MLHVNGGDLRRVHVQPSGHPVWTEVITDDKQGQFAKESAFFVRLDNGTRQNADQQEVELYVTQRWGPT